MDFWLNQALGLLGSLIVFISVQFNNRRVILAAQATACLMWIVHYGLLGAMTAATINILSFARSVVFYQRPQVGQEPRVAVGVSGAVYRQHRPHMGRTEESAARHRHEHDDGRALDARHAPHAPALSDQFAVLVHV